VTGAVSPAEGLDTSQPGLIRASKLRIGEVACGAAFVVVAAVVAIIVGPADLPVSAVLTAIVAKIPGLGVHSTLNSIDSGILWQIRAPRIALGGIVGATLALSGASYQGVFQNALADPYLLGVASGAGLGATIAIAVAHVGAGSTIGLLPIAAFAGAVAAVSATYLLGKSGTHRNTQSLLLAGVAIGSFLTAIQTFVQQRSEPTLQQVYSWILGGLSTASWQQVVLVIPYVAVAGAVLLSCRRLLDVLAVGDEEARSLGVNPQRMRMLVVAAATLGTAAVVSVSGLIGFVGIIVPHTIRLVVGPSYRRILPLSVLFGAGFLILADLVARTILSPAEVPLGVVTAGLGAPFFLIVLKNARSLG
jgi:iron complex transport system permease protein